MSDYDSPGQQRILRALVVIAGSEFTGVTPSEYAKAMNVTASTATRDFHNLQAQGFLEEIPGTGRWRLGARPIQIAMKCLNELQSAGERVEEMKKRYTREF